MLICRIGILHESRKIIGLSACHTIDSGHGIPVLPMVQGRRGAGHGIPLGIPPGDNGMFPGRFPGFLEIHLIGLAWIFGVAAWRAAVKLFPRGISRILDMGNARIENNSMGFVTISERMDVRFTAPVIIEKGRLVEIQPFPVGSWTLPEKSGLPLLSLI